MEHLKKYRDSVTGYYVSREYAEANPATTQSEEDYISTHYPPTDDHPQPDLAAADEGPWTERGAEPDA